jgi:SET domain-containing protein
MNTEFQHLWKIDNSPIHGKGVFAVKKIPSGKKIGVGIHFQYWVIPVITPEFGSMINHSYNSNTMLEYNDNKWYIVSNKLILPGQELTLNYNDTPWYIQKAKSYYK